MGLEPRTSSLEHTWLTSRVWCLVYQLQDLCGVFYPGPQLMYHVCALYSAKDGMFGYRATPHRAVVMLSLPGVPSITLWFREAHQLSMHANVVVSFFE